MEVKHKHKEGVQLFINKELELEVRAVEINGKPYFVAIDIAKALGYVNPSDAVKKHCRWVAKREIPHPQSKTKTLQVNIIPEGDMYRLIANSGLPSAEKFESWIFDEVLPQIRKTGGYIPISEEMSEAEIMAKALIISQKTIEKKDELLKAKDKEIKGLSEDLNQKNRFINQLAASENTLLVREVAKVASKADVVIGEKRLWSKLREWGLIFKNSTEPKQCGIDRGYFEVNEGTKETKGKVFTYRTTRITGKGQAYIIKKLLEEVN